MKQALRDRQRIDELKHKIAHADEDERPFLIYELAGLENQDAEFKGQKEKERVRPVTSIEEDLRQEQESLSSPFRWNSVVMKVVAANVGGG